MFIKELDETINNVKSKQDIIILGDMNIDTLTQNNKTIKYLEMLLSNGLHCIVNESTREDVSRKTSTYIDHVHVRTNKTNAKTHATVVRTTISDHYSIFCCICKKNEEIEEQLNQSSETKMIRSAQVNSN